MSSPYKLEAPYKFEVVSTFAGGGGSSTGYRMAGGNVLLAVEWDDNAVATYKANYPNTPVYHGDIANLSVDECLQIISKKPGELDILDGSPPCQGFSTAGRRDPGDDRNQLFRQYVRLLRGIQPKTFVMENVSGMVKGNMKLIFAEILKELKDSGYKVSARLLNAMYYGVPQSRERMIFICVREDLEIEPSHPKPRTKPITVRQALADLPEDTERTLSEAGFSYWLKLKPGDSFDKAHPRGSWFNAIKLNPDRPCPTIAKSTLSPTGSAGLHHWAYPRSLNFTELKRLASFPDDYILTGDFRNKWARVGNAVPPLLMKAVAEHIYENILLKLR